MKWLSMTALLLAILVASASPGGESGDSDIERLIERLKDKDDAVCRQSRRYDQRIG